MNKEFRSTCIIASALDLIGDKWSLLIVRDMLLHRKKTFKQLVSSDEGVATNLLSSRLKLLESIGVITKQKLESNRKENIYLLTEKGIDLAPMIMELVIWSDKNVRVFNSKMNRNEFKSKDKSRVVTNFQKEYRKFAQQVIAS